MLDPKSKIQNPKSLPMTNHREWEENCQDFALLGMLADDEFTAEELEEIFGDAHIETEISCLWLEGE